MKNTSLEKEKIKRRPDFKMLTINKDGCTPSKKFLNKKL